LHSEHCAVMVFYHLQSGLSYEPFKNDRF